MRLAVPILSLAGLVVISTWAVLNRQTDSSMLMATSLSLVTEFMPYLMLLILAAQVTLVYLQLRPRALANRTALVEAGEISMEKPDTAPEQMNTEWVLDALAGGVIVTDQQGKITYMNSSAEKLTLWQRDKVLGEHIGKILKLEDMQGNPLGERAFEANRAHPGHPLQFGQVKLIPRVGDFRFVELNTTCILENCKAVVFIFRDVTSDRKIINRLYRQASHDALTDLMNRTSFEQYVEQLAHDTSSLTRTHVLASVDLDNL